MRYNANPSMPWPNADGGFPFLCRVVDANGQTLDSVIACDTETGEAFGHVIKDGLLLVNETTDELLTYHRYFPAPLRLVRLTVDQVPYYRVVKESLPKTGISPLRAAYPYFRILEDFNRRGHTDSPCKSPPAPVE